MAHLTCKAHKQRVMVIKAGEGDEHLKTLHRTDGAECNGLTLKLGKFGEFQPWLIELRNTVENMKREQ